jgi:hypothetical protein
MGFAAWIALGAARSLPTAVPFSPGGDELADVASASGTTDAS